jgi:hypothetical protein
MCTPAVLSCNRHAPGRDPTLPLLPTFAAYTGPDNFTAASGVNFTFHNLWLSQQDAEDMCGSDCGHLVAYTSLVEQADTEGFYIDNVGGGPGALHAACLPFSEQLQRVRA